jgi:hypothetical protein
MPEYFFLFGLTRWFKVPADKIIHLTSLVESIPHLTLVVDFNRYGLFRIESSKPFGDEDKKLLMGNIEHGDVVIMEEAYIGPIDSFRIDITALCFKYQPMSAGSPIHEEHICIVDPDRGYKEMIKDTIWRLEGRPYNAEGQDPTKEATNVMHGKLYEFMQKAAHEVTT